MLFGEYSHQLDAKGRLRLPAKLKPDLGNNSTVMKGANGCLLVFAPDKIADINQKIKNIPLGDTEAQNAVRILFSSAYVIEEDPQGRFILPQKLREHAKIVKNVVIIGAGDRAEIWAEERWNEFNSGTNVDAAFQTISTFQI